MFFMKFSDEKLYVGHIDQLFRVKTYNLLDGRAKGVKAVDIDSGSGLELTLIPDRCMDFFQLKFKGKNLNYITPNGVCGPQYYDGGGNKWLYNTFLGFLTTCGLDNIGKPKDGCGLHGRISNTPAENFSVRIFNDENDAPYVILSGTMKQAHIFGENLSLTRAVRINYRENTLYFTDTLENCGYKNQEFKLMYHFNFGYPLLCEDTKIILPTQNIIARDGHAQAHMEDYLKITPPSDEYTEMCYFHKLKKNENGRSEYSVLNKKENIGVSVNYDSGLLDHFVQWKMFGSGEYVTGLEPCNAALDGQSDKEPIQTKILKPQEKLEYNFIIKCFEA